jgi:hypothetical protein
MINNYSNILSMPSQAKNETGRKINPAHSASTSLSGRIIPYVQSGNHEPPGQLKQKEQSYIIESIF